MEKATAQHQIDSEYLPRRPTDEELLATDFTVRNPYEIEGLVERVREGVVPVDIVYAYDWNDEVRCAFCPQHQKHKRGYVVRLPTGELAPIGNVCGSKHFGGRWEEWEREHRFRSKRKYYLERVAPLSDAIVKALPLLKHWRMPLYHVEQFKHEMEKKASTLFDELRYAAVRQSGTLIVTERRRDHAAEDERDRGLKPDHPNYGKPIYREVSESVGQIAGHEFLGADLRHMLEDAQNKLLAAQQRLVAEHVPTSELQAAVRDVRDARALLKTVAELHRAFRRFLGTDNLTRIAKWARNAVPGIRRCNVKGDRLIYKDQWGSDDSEVVAIPTGVAPLDERVLAVLEVDKPLPNDDLLSSANDDDASATDSNDRPPAPRS